MFELATIIKNTLSSGITDTYWVKEPVSSDLKDISVVFNLVLTDTRGTFDQSVIVQTYTLDVYLNVPENKFQELKSKSIYIKQAILPLYQQNQQVKYVRFVAEELSHLEDTKIFSNRLSFEVQFVTA